MSRVLKAAGTPRERASPDAVWQRTDVSVMMKVSYGPGSTASESRNDASTRVT